jgi:hypothetical protein
VLNSQFEKAISKGAPRSSDHPFISRFPVFNGSNSSGGGIQLDARDPRVVFANRTNSGRLMLEETDLSALTSRLQFSMA